MDAAAVVGEPAPDTVAAFAVPQQAATTFHAPAMALAMKIMMAGFISDAAHRMATEAKRAQNAASEHQLQNPPTSAAYCVVGGAPCHPTRPKQGFCCNSRGLVEIADSGWERRPMRRGW